MENNTLFSPGEAIEAPEQKTLPEYFEARAKHFDKLGRSAFLVDGLSEEKLYFKNYETETRKVASKFYKNGLRKNDIVIYMSSCQIRQLLLISGVWRANGVLRSLYAEESSDVVLQKVRESKARWIFCDSEAGPEVLKAVSQCDWAVEILIAVSEGPVPPGCVSFDEYLIDDGEECPCLDVSENDLALILPTSGTTGPSKGAMHSHKSALTMILNYASYPWTYPKCNVIATKSTHVSGLILPLIMISVGSTGVVLPKVNKEILIKTVDKYKPGFVFAFPAFLLALGSADAEGFDVTSIEILASGGGTTTPGMLQAFLDIGNVKGFINGYGLTEGASLSTSANFSPNTQLINYPDAPASAVGKPFPGVLVQVRNFDTLETLGPNQNGEIWTKGEFVFMGYFLNAESTKDTLVDGWLRTGDVGYYDDQGFLYVVDRKKEIFKYLNNHISPTDLENVIFKHPLVEEVCVIGVPDEMGEVPRAFVTVKNLVVGCNKMKICEDIQKFANDRLASYKQIRGGVYIIEELPKGKTGKVERNSVKKLNIPNY